jgi:hypothetical protein
MKCTRGCLEGKRGVVTGSRHGVAALKHLGRGVRPSPRIRSVRGTKDRRWGAAPKRQAEVPPGGPVSTTDGRTASHLIPGAGRTSDRCRWSGVLA